MDVLSKIIEKMEGANLTDKRGKIYLDFDGITTNITSKDIVGNSLQDWFGKWLSMNEFQWTQGAHSQSWPDFILSDDSHLELKTFNHDADPAFDIANFDAFIHSLYNGHVHRLDTPHLVFSYSVDGQGFLRIVQFWKKSIWEITGPSDTNIMALQIKRNNMPSNIRPKNWRSSKVKLFTSRKEFVCAIYAVIQRYGLQSKFQTDWFEKVSADYECLTGHPL